MGRYSFTRVYISVTFALLLAVLAAVVGVAEAQPALADNTGSQSVMSAAIRSESGVVQQDFVVWRCPDLGLCEANYSDKRSGGSWVSGEIPGMGPLGSRPTIALDSDPSHEAGGFGFPYQYVFWEGNSPNNLYMAYWNGTGGTNSDGWHGPIDLGKGTLGSAPSTPQIYYDGTGNGGDELVVAWRGTNGYLWHTESSNPTSASSWSAATSATAGGIPSGDTLGVIDAYGGQVSAWWKGGDNNLWSASVIGNITYGPCSFHMGPLGSDPSAVWNQLPEGVIGDEGVILPASAVTGSRAVHVDQAEDATAPSGNCPVNALGDTWFGDTGVYDVCWGANSGNGIWCLWWGDNAENGEELEGPFQALSAVLGTAPVLASDSGASTYVPGYWGAGSALSPDLWSAPNLDESDSYADTGVTLSP